MNWGGFFGGLAQGVESGVRMAKTLRDAQWDKRLNEIRAKGLEEANADRERAIRDAVKDAGSPTATSDVIKAPGADQPQAAAPNSAVQPVPVERIPAGPDERQPAPTATVPDATAMPSPEPNTPTSQAAATVQDTTKPAIMTTPDRLAQGGITQTPQPAYSAASSSAPAMQQGTAANQPVTGDISKMGLQKRFRVGDQSFDTREQAEAYAQKNTPSAWDMYVRNGGATKYRDELLAQGDVKGAQEWDNYISSNKTKTAMNDWARGAGKVINGDWDTGIDELGKFYTHNVDDGVDYVGKELVKDQDGNVIGARIKLKNKGNDKESVMELDNKGILRMAAMGNPEKLFEISRQDMKERDQEANKVRLKKMDVEAADRRLGYTQDRLDQREAFQQGQQNKRQQMQGDQALARITLEKTMDAANIGAKEKAQLSAKFDALRAAGYTDAAINEMVPELVGAASHKKTTDPTERRALVIDTLMKNELNFSKRPEAEQKAKVDQMMKLIYGAEPGAAPKTPAAGGLPAQSQASPTSAPQFVKDTQTGEIFQIINGRRVPTGKRVPQ